MPREDGVFRADSGEGNEELPFGNIDGLFVNSRRDTNQRPASVVKLHRIDRRLHRLVVAASVLRHSHHTTRHYCGNSQVTLY